MPMRQALHNAAMHKDDGTSINEGQIGQVGYSWLTDDNTRVLIPES